MARYHLQALGTFCLLAGLVAGAAAGPGTGQSTLLANPVAARANVAASPKFDDRVLVHPARPVNASILAHDVDDRVVVLSVGAQDGVRFGHAFGIFAPGSEECVGTVKVMELERQRCVAKVISLDPSKAGASVKGFNAVYSDPKPDAMKTTITCEFGKDVWQTESYENKLIKALLESGGEQVQILIREENGDRGRDK